MEAERSYFIQVGVVGHRDPKTGGISSSPIYEEVTEEDFETRRLPGHDRAMKIGLKILAEKFAAYHRECEKAGIANT